MRLGRRCRTQGVAGNLQGHRPKPQSPPGGAPSLEWVRERHSEFLTHWGLSQNVVSCRPQFPNPEEKP